ncbi:MAG: NAD(P)/FAD-dependent oxidoreductase [Bradymonadaceae bacterium]
MHPKSSPEKEIFDVAVIGGGPAGLTATMWLGRYLREVVLIDAGDPRNWQTKGVHGVLGHQSIRPAKLRRRGRRQCREHGASLVDGHVEAIHRLEPDEFEICIEKGPRLRARRVLITTGVKDRWPDIPNLERCYGTSVHTCPHCDGFESRGTRTVVIGWEAKAAEVALALLTWTRQVIICTHGHAPNFGEELGEKIRAREIPVIDAPITVLEERHRHLQGIDFEGGGVLECEHLFIAMGQVAVDDLGTQLECERDEIGRILIDDTHHTSSPHVYAAGDITPGLQLVTLAAAEGLNAARAIHHSLKETR